MSDSVWPQRRQPTRLPRPWDSPGKNTGVGCHFLLQCMKVKSEVKSLSMSDSLRPRGLQPTRLLHPWDFPGKSTGVGCHCLLRVVNFFYMSNFSEISGLPRDSSCFNSEVWWAMNLICKKLFLFFPLFLYIKWGTLKRQSTGISQCWIKKLQNYLNGKITVSPNGTLVLRSMPLLMEVYQRFSIIYFTKPVLFSNNIAL